MKLSTLTYAKKIVARSKALTTELNILERTTSTKIIFVLSDGHNFSLYIDDDDITDNLVVKIHELAITYLSEQRQKLRNEFEKL